jgi:hypothetical protein
MKSILLVLLELLLVHTVSAQLTITPGAQFSSFSDTKLTLENTDLVNNGNLLIATTSPVSFTGDAASFIAGDGAVQLFKLEINKTGNQSVSLRKTIGVGSNVQFTAGFLNLNGFNLDLGSTGRLVNENENSRVIGTNGGQVIANAVLNGPSLENPGNLGAIISSTQNLGNVIVKRGHQPQKGNGLTRSISRYFDITPANNINLDASLQINYFDGELNGLDENILTFFKTDDGVNWTSQGFASRNTSTNFVTKTSISSFSRWTLSNINTALPVLFTLFNAKCEGNRVAITWKTGQELNSDHFDIEKSIDGISWTVIGNVPAAGNSASEKTYSFIDNNPGQKNSYRVAEYDIDRRPQYTIVLTPSCDLTDKFSVWPNPLHDVIVINIVTSNDSRGMISIFDNKGALVKRQEASILQGSNQLRVDLTSLANGVYTLQASWSNGEISKAVKIIKQ